MSLRCVRGVTQVRTVLELYAAVFPGRRSRCSDALHWGVAGAKTGYLGMVAAFRID